MNEPSIQQIITGMPSRFDPNAAKGMVAVLQFRLMGDEAIDFHAVIDNGHCSTGLGVHKDPTITIRTTVSTYIDMVMGRVTGQEAFFKRRLRYEGPISLAIKLHKLFRSPE